MLSACQRSRVRGFRRSSAASSCFVRNSERIGSELDIANSYTLFCLRMSHCGDLSKKLFTESWGDFLSYASSSNGVGPHLRATGRIRAHFRAPLIASIMLS
jgi:hypothetical protein